MRSSQTFGGLARLGLRSILLHETAHPRDWVLLFLAGLLNWISLEAHQKQAPRRATDQTKCHSWFSPVPSVWLPTKQTSLPLSSSALWNLAGNFAFFWHQHLHFQGGPWVSGFQRSVQSLHRRPESWGLQPRAGMAYTGGGTRRLAKQWESCRNQQAVLCNILIFQSIFSVENPAFAWCASACAPSR